MALNTNACYGQPKLVQVNTTGEKLPYGIFSVAEYPEAGTPFWQQGVEWERELCGPAGVYDCPTCTQNNDNEAPVKTYVSGVPLEDAFPFTVYASFKCSPIGHWSDAEDRARAALRSGEERAVELAIAEGTHVGQRSLYDASTLDITPTAGTPVSVQAGFALLEQYIGANGKGQGVILGARRDVLLAASEHIVERTESGLYTALGTPIAALSGINGKTGPNNDAPEANEAWLWGLGSRPRIWSSPEFLTSVREASLDTDNNDLEILAERTYVVGWDCFTVGVLITTVGSAGAN